MTITRQPNDFTPLSEGQVFAFDTGETTPTDVEVHVIDMGSFQTITRQKLFGVTSGEIDVAPYIGRMLDAEPCTDSGSVLKAAPHVCYTVTFNDVRSDKIYTCLNKAVPALPSWLSTMTQQRRLLYGERDEVLLFGPRGSVFEVLLVADAGTDVSLTCAGECGAALFCLDTLDYPEGVRSIEAWFTCNGEELLTIFYTVERDRGTAQRRAEHVRNVAFREILRTKPLFHGERIQLLRERIRHVRLLLRGNVRLPLVRLGKTELRKKHVAHVHLVLFAQA